MKSLFSLIFLFLFSNLVLATNLCDTSCNLTISFPSGGSIEATEALTFTFGTGGVLDLGATGTINAAVQPASTDFSAGGTLALTAGESITFDAGGSLDLGTGGNIDHTNMSIDTTGDITIEATGIAGTITISDMSIADGTISINSDAIVENSLTISGDATFSGTGLLTVSSSGSLTAAEGTIVLVDIIDFSASVINILPPTEMTIDGVLYQIEYKIINEEQVTVLTAPDGTTGTIEIIDGQPIFVPDNKNNKSNWNGSIDLFMLLNLLAALTMLRRQGNCFSIR